MHKIIINRRHGCFEFSPEAIVKYYEIQDPSLELWFYRWSSGCLERVIPGIDQDYDICLIKDHGRMIKDDWESDRFIPDIHRMDPVMIQVITDLGSAKASSSISRLAVTEFEGDLYRIREYDGLEWIETPGMIKWEKVE